MTFQSLGKPACLGENSQPDMLALLVRRMLAKKPRFYPLAAIMGCPTVPLLVELLILRSSMCFLKAAEYLDNSFLSVEQMLSPWHVKQGCGEMTSEVNLTVVYSKGAMLSCCACGRFLFRVTQEMDTNAPTSMLCAQENHSK